MEKSHLPISTARAFMIPGLALNPSVMGDIQVPQLPISYVRWIDPVKDEPMDQYASRIAQLYDIQGEVPHVFVGHSLGGLLAQQLGALFPDSIVVLISSIKSGRELPRSLRFLRNGFAYHLATKEMIKRTFGLWGSYHGYKRPDVKEALLDELDTLDNNYLIWAYKQLIYWTDRMISNPYLHIHGSQDRTFPLKYISGCKVVKGGDHLMIVKHSDEINLLIADFLKKEGH